MADVNELSLMLTKGYKAGFFTDVSLNEEAYLRQEAKTLLENDAGFAAIFAVRSKYGLNILDWGVERGEDKLQQREAIQAACLANPEKEFYFPPGDYRLDTELVVTQGNSFLLHRDARIFAGSIMPTLITYAYTGTGYQEDKGFYGGWLDGALKANKLLTLQKIIHFTLAHTIFSDGINRGLQTVAGLGAELIAYDLRFFNTGKTNAVDNIAIESNMGDSHFRDIVMRSWTVGVKDTAGNRWDRIHPWIGPDEGANNQMTTRYPISIAFDLTGPSDLQGCMADTYRTAYKFRDNGTGFTPLARLRNCHAAWTDQPTLPQSVIDSNQAYVFDNSEGAGVNCTDFTMKGHNTGSPVKYLLGSLNKLNIRNTFSDGFIVGEQLTNADSFEYRNGVQQGVFLFTPTLYGDTGAGSHSYTNQTGRVTVDGNFLTYNIRITATLDSTAGFSGSLRIGGLPVPINLSGVRDASGNVGYSVNINASGAFIFGSPTPWITLLTMGTTGMTEVSVGGQALRAKAIDIAVKVSALHYKA